MRNNERQLGSKGYFVQLIYKVYLRFRWEKSDMRNWPSV